jgi:hypothetical protein
MYSRCTRRACSAAEAGSRNALQVRRKLLRSAFYDRCHTIVTTTSGGRSSIIYDGMDDGKLFEMSVVEDATWGDVLLSVA